MTAARDIVGRRFGKLVAQTIATKRTGRARRRWNCLCDCGERAVVTQDNLVSGHARSCGCLQERVKGEAGGQSKTAEYRAWEGMIRRCESPKCAMYRHYGGRGIKVHPPWRASVLNFIRDVGRRPSPKHSLDRIDNNGNYEPGNVRWATADIQSQNRRKPKRFAWQNSAKYAYDVVRAFESVVASYAGAKYAVAVDSCTNALLIACAWYCRGKHHPTFEIPKFTYVGVPCSIVNAGGKVKFRDEDWIGSYKLEPYPIYDCARHMTSGMYKPGSFMCLSFHWSKHLAIGRGGMILCDDPEAAAWMRRARFDGREEGKNPKNDEGLIVGWHAYMIPPLAAQGLMLMASMKEHNEPLPNSDYPDLSLHRAFL